MSAATTAAAAAGPRNHEGKPPVTGGLTAFH